MSESIVMFWWMLVGHAVADFAMQPRDMMRGKNRHNIPDFIPPGQKISAVWPYWLTSHAVSHGGAVTLATGSIEMGIAEAIAHWLIDFAKCENWTNPHQDQMLHVLCKVVWLGMLL